MPSRKKTACTGNIDQLFTEIKTGLKNGFATYGKTVQAIGVDTWGVDYGLLDADGNLVNTPFQYRDSRTTYESLAMRYRFVFQTLEKLHGQRLEKLHIVGGGCQNKSSTSSR